MKQKDESEKSKIHLPTDGHGYQRCSCNGAATFSLQPDR